MHWSLCKLIKMRCYHENKNELWLLIENNGKVRSSTTWIQKFTHEALRKTEFLVLVYKYLPGLIPNTKLTVYMVLFQLSVHSRWFSSICFTQEEYFPLVLPLRHTDLKAPGKWSQMWKEFTWGYTWTIRLPCAGCDLAGLLSWWHKLFFLFRSECECFQSSGVFHWVRFRSIINI